MLFSTVPPEPEQRLVLCHPGTGLPAGPRTSLCSVSPPGQSRNCEQSRGQPGCSCIPCPPSASILFQQVWGHAAAGTLAVQGWYQRGGGDSRDPWWAVLSLCLFRLQLLPLVFYPMSSVHSEVPAAGQPRALRPPSQHTALTDGGSLMCMGRWCQAVAGECWGSSHTRAAALKGV